MIGKLKEKMIKTYNLIHNSVLSVLGKGVTVSETELEELEAVLLQTDMGIEVTEGIIEKIRKRSKDGDMFTPLRNQLYSILNGTNKVGLNINPEGPTIILILGVNGTGKTTTIGKLAYRLKKEGNSLLLGACDTFRAAAIEQLEEWASKVGVDIVKQQYGADPAAIAYDAVTAAKSRGIDFLILDTAGRFHTRTELMDELKKITRVVGKLESGAPHEKLLVIDATTGQNAFQQTKVFNEELALTGIILTKLDGTAKGGITVRIYKELGIPIKFIGVGQELEDLLPFNAKEYVDAIV